MPPFRDLPEYHFWRVLSQIADEAEDAVADELIASLLAFARAADQPAVRQAIEAALRSGDIEAAIEAIPWDDLDDALLTVIDRLEDSTAEAVRATVRELELRSTGRSLRESARLSRTTASVTLAFDVPNRRAIEFLEEHGAELVGLVGEESRAAIRNIVLAGHRDFLPISEQVNRIMRVVGLTRRQAAAVANYRASLVDLLEGRTSEGAIKGRFTLTRDFGLKTLTEDRTETLVRRYRDRLLRHRARGIARNEAAIASAAGQDAGWEEAIANGLLDPSEWDQEWVAIVPDPDGRTCPLCQHLDGKRTAIGALFVAELTEEGILRPPRHHLCRCTRRLVRRSTRRAPVELAAAGA